MPTPTRNKPASISLDFSNVGERRQGRPAAHVPAGDYILQIKDYEIRTKKDDESKRHISWTCEISKPSQYAGKTIYYISSLVPENLWNLRNLLEDIGVKVPKKMVDVPLGKLVGKAFGATLDDDDYNPEKPRFTIFPAVISIAQNIKSLADEDEI